MKLETLYTFKTLAIAMVMAFSLNSCGQSNGTESKTSEVETTEAKAPKMTIHDAVISGNLEIVKQHIAAKTDLNKKDPFGSSSPLILATVFGRDEIAKELIEQDVQLNITNNDGSTAIHTAAFFCRTEILEMLLSAGADKSIRNNFGSTALESVQAPFKDVEGIYNMMGQQLKGMGLQLDMERIKETRPVIAEMLK